MRKVNDDVLIDIITRATEDPAERLLLYLRMTEDEPTPTLGTGTSHEYTYWMRTTCVR